MGLVVAAVHTTRVGSRACFDVESGVGGLGLAFVDVCALVGHLLVDVDLRGPRRQLALGQRRLRERQVTRRGGVRGSSDRVLHARRYERSLGYGEPQRTSSARLLCFASRLAKASALKR